jgi:hypothetical protein
MANPRYTVPSVVLSNTLAVSEKKGTPSVKIQLQTRDEQPRILYADLWLSDAAYEGSVNTLREVFGWQGVDIREFANPILAGLDVDAVCEQEWYQPDGGEGKNQEKVKFLNAPGGSGGMKTLDQPTIDNVFGRLNAKIAALGRAPGAAPARTAPAAGGRTGVPPYAPPAAGGRAGLRLPTAKQPPVQGGSYLGEEPPPARGRGGSDDIEDYLVH